MTALHCVQVQTWQGQRHRVEVSGDEVKDLRETLQKVLKSSPERIQVLSRGKPMKDTDLLSLLQPTDWVLAIVLPEPPPTFSKSSHSHHSQDGQDPDALKFQLPPTATQLERRIANFLQRKMHLPDLMLIILFGVRPWVWLAAAAWILFAPLAAKLEIGPLYVLGTIVTIIIVNLGKRKEGEASAYTIFNQFRALPGQLTADETDRQMRQGQM